MTSVQIVLCVVTVLVSTVYSEQCIKCVGRNREDCDGKKTVECGDLGCMTISKRCIVEGTTLPSITMDCAEQKLCGGYLHFDTLNNEMDIKVSVICCKGDLCNEKIPYSLPEDEGELNGKLCESCFTNNTKAECSSTERMACRGPQNKCLSYAATVYRSDNIVVDYSMKGCISEKGCSMGFDALPGYRKERVFQCSETLDS